MSWVPLVGILTAATVVVATGTVIVFASWESIEADPSSVFRTLANNIENDPNRIKNLLYQIADNLITPEGLVMPGTYARKFVEVMLNQTFDTWNLPLNLTPAAGTENFPIKRRIEDAVLHRIIFESVADNIAQGPNAVASINEALRSAADRIDAGETGRDIALDLGMSLTPNLQAWTDIRTGILLPRSSGLTPSQKQSRYDIFITQFGEAVAKETCIIGSLGAGYEDFLVGDSVYTSSNSCTLTNSELVTRLGNGLTTLSTLQAAWEAAEAARAVSNRKTYRRVPY